MREWESVNSSGAERQSEALSLPANWAKLHYIIHYTLYRENAEINTAHCTTVYNVYDIHYPPIELHCTVYNVFDIHCSLHSAHCIHCTLYNVYGIHLGVFDMPNSNRYDILSISIFCRIPLSISISISIFSRMAISISIFFKLSLLISIFSKFPYRYFYRYRYFPNFLIDMFSI